jgi:hypothetical protein
MGHGAVPILGGVCEHAANLPRANSPSALPSKHVRRQPLADVNFASLSVFLGRRLGLRWQLQNRRVLALVERGEQHNVPTGEFQRIVMHVRLVQMDLPEPSHFFTNRLGLAKKTKPRRLPLDLLLEHNLGARKKAYGDALFSNGGETARYRIGELRRY